MSKFKMKIAAKQIVNAIKLKASEAECTTDQLLKEINKEFGLPGVEFRFESLVKELHIHTTENGPSVSDLRTQITEALVDAVNSANLEESKS